MDTETIKELATDVNNVAKQAFQSGFEQGLRAFAWWKDGVQYVGTCGATLEQALKECRKGIKK